jgi:hypothetical protein
MANIQIPNLPAVVSLAGEELFEGVQSGTSVKISLSQIIAATRAGLPTTLPIPVSLGGTGAVTLTGYVKGSGTSPLTASATIPSGDITGLGTMSVQNANAVAITGGSVTGITDITVSDGGTGVSTLSGYVKGSGTSPLTASATIPSSDISGLGTMATQNANAVAITGGAAALTGVSSVTVSSASPALTVTQTGAGNAILVEDSTSPDSTPFVVNSLGRVGIGTATPTSPLSIAGATAKMDLLGTVSASIAISADSIVSVDLKKAGDNDIGSRINFNKSRGTTAAPTPVISGDGIGHINYLVYQGLTQVRVSSIDSYVDTFTADNDFSTIITFSTRPNGVESPVVERLRIGPAGQFGIGGANYGTSGQALVSGGSGAAPSLISGGVGVAPSYGKIGLTTHVSGILPVATGGTGVDHSPRRKLRACLGFTSTVTTGMASFLTNTSSQYQSSTGTLSHSSQLPVTSTSSTGRTFHIVNNSSSTLNILAANSATMTTHNAKCDRNGIRHLYRG